MKKIFRFLNIYWLFFRIVKEVKSPTTITGKKISDIIFSIINKNKNKQKNNILLCFYDLNIAPITYNFCEFLVMCNKETLSKGFKKYKIIFLKKNFESKINQVTQHKIYNQIHNKNSIEWRFSNIIIPLISCSESCSGYDIIEEDKELENYLKYRNIYPKTFSKFIRQHVDTYEIYNHYENLKNIGLTPPSNGIYYINKLFEKISKNKKIITITLRIQEFDKARNSNIKSWVKFAYFARENGFEPIIIPDTDDPYITDNDFKDFIIFHEGSFNLMLRMSLYSYVYFNFFAGGGPSSLCYLSENNKYIMFNYGPVKNSIVHTKEAFNKFKEQPIDKFKFANSNQILVWKEDTYDNIVESFNKHLLNTKTFKTLN